MKIDTSLGPLERKIVGIIWKKQRCTVKTVQDIVNTGSEKKLAYTTVMTILVRLADKGILNRRKEGRFYYYFPKATKETYVKTLIHRTVAQLVKRFGDEAVLAFAEEVNHLSSAQKKKVLKKIDIQER